MVSVMPQPPIFTQFKFRKTEVGKKKFSQRMVCFFTESRGTCLYASTIPSVDKGEIEDVSLDGGSYRGL